MNSAKFIVRNSLLFLVACITFVPIVHAEHQDVGVIAIEPLSNSDAFNAPRSISVVIQNFSPTDGIRRSAFALEYRVGSGNWRSERISSSTLIAAGGTYTYTTSSQVDFIEAGDYLVEARTVLDSDEDTSNDQFSATFRITEREGSSTVVSSFPYTEGFETGAGNWTPFVYGGGTSFVRGNPAGTYKSGAASGSFAFATGLFSTTTPNTKTQVISPIFDLTKMQFAEVGLSVMWESPGGIDGARLDYSTNDGETWEIVGTNGDPENWYTRPSVQGLDIGNGPTPGWTGYFTSGGSSTPYSTSGYTTAGGLGSNGYLDAKNVITGGAMTRFRLVYGARNSGDEGFAFDNFTVLAGGTANLTAALQSDSNADGVADPGDVIRFTAVLDNATSTMNFTTAMFTLASLDPSVALVVGSATTSAGTILSGNGGGDTTVSVDIGTVGHGSTVTITYDLVVLSENATFITACSQGTFSSDQFTTLTDNPATLQGSADKTCVIASDANGTLSYGTTTFSEAAANNGTIGDTVAITLAGDIFAASSGALVEGTDFTATNVPTGLSPVVTRTSSTTAVFSLVGAASLNDVTNNISNLTLNFLNPAFAHKKASKFSGSTKVFAVNFVANPKLIPTVTPTPIGVVSAESPRPKLSVRKGVLTIEITDTVRSYSRDYFAYVVRSSDSKIVYKTKFKLSRKKGKLVVRNLELGEYRVFTVTKRKVKPRTISSRSQIVQVQ